MARSDLKTFWKPLEDSRFTGQPSKVNKDDVRRTGLKLGWSEPEIEVAISGLREFLRQKE